MKKLVFNKLSVLFLFIVFIFVLSSCEKDIYEQNSKSKSREVLVKDISLKSLDKSISSKIEEKISLIKNYKNSTNQQGRFEYNNLLGIYIDTENGK